MNSKNKSNIRSTYQYTSKKSRVTKWSLLDLFYPKIIQKG